MNLTTKQLSEHAARKLTDEVKAKIADLWTELLLLYEGQAHIALGYTSWRSYWEAEFGQNGSRGDQLLQAGRVMRSLDSGEHVRLKPQNDRVARELVPLLKKPEVLNQAWQEAISDDNPPTASRVKAIVARLKPKKRTKVDASPSDPEDPQPTPQPPKPTFNRVNDNIGWAKWSWNPVTGCKHNCVYCYARDIANRFYPEGFEPTFHPDRLLAPQHTKIPKHADNDPAWRRVFTCSMADLFGKWVPKTWIDAVFEQIVAAPQWQFLCLTKFPQKLAKLDWPDNAWVGTTVDKQSRVQLAQRHFANVHAGVKWLSCEPLLGPLKFDSLEMFDWVVIGSQTRTTGAPAKAPQLDWVIDLYQQARSAKCKVYLKHNLIGPTQGGEDDEDKWLPGIQPVREWPR